MLPLLTGMTGMRHEDPDARRGLALLKEGKPDEALKAFEGAEGPWCRPCLVVQQEAGAAEPGRAAESGGGLRPGGGAGSRVAARADAEAAWDGAGSRR